MRVKLIGVSDDARKSESVARRTQTNRPLIAPFCAYPSVHAHSAEVHLPTGRSKWSRVSGFLAGTIASSTTQTRRQAQQPIECATDAADSWMNEIRPKKLISCRRINRDRHGKEGKFVCRYSCRAVAYQ